MESKPETALQEKRSDEEIKADLIVDYIEKFGAIAGRVVTEEAFKLYIEALWDIETRKLRKGLKRYLQNGTAWPWPGTLREYCEDEI